MTIEQDLEILKSVKIARQNYARVMFHAIEGVEMYCPVCGTSCTTFCDIINMKRILHCPHCHMMYDVRINREVNE